MTSEANVDQIVIDHFFAGRRTGTVIEVGAAKPDFLSIGAGFRAVGWRVISVEPNPDFAKLHRDLGHEIVEVAAGDVDEDDVEFTIARGIDLQYEGGEITAESFSSLGIRGQFQDMFTTLSDRFKTETIRVKKRRLSTILAELPAIQSVDVLAIDVEGWELECLRGFPFDKLAPKVAIVENLFTEPEVGLFMEGQGYTLWQTLKPNDVYIKSGGQP